MLRRLRAGGDDVGVLVVTAAREADTVRAAASGGAVHYLVKPFDYDDLRVRLESFRAAHLALSGSAAPGQQDIDAVFGGTAPAAAAALPKGLSPETADAVEAALHGCRRAVRGRVRRRRRHLARLRAALPRALRRPRRGRRTPAVRRRRPTRAALPQCVLNPLAAVSVFRWSGGPGRTA